MGFRCLRLVAALLLAEPDLVRAQASDRAAPSVTNLAGGPVHIHDGDLHGLVLRGLLRMALADSSGRLVLREYPPGSFVVVPAGRAISRGAAPRPRST